MKINEIEIVASPNFPISTVEHILSLSRPIGALDDLTVYYAEHDNERALILVGNNREVAAYAGFEIWNNGKVWQAKNAQSYGQFKGRQLVGKLYVYAKEQLKKSIQSDADQSYEGKRLWTNTLPSLGLRPMVFDAKTEKIIDPAEFDLALMYPSDLSDDLHRYTWIVERFDHYPSQNLLKEGSLLMPVQGLWKRAEQWRD